jgi:hypothetical protein
MKHLRFPGLVALGLAFAACSAASNHLGTSSGSPGGAAATSSESSAGTGGASATSGTSASTGLFDAGVGGGGGAPPGVCTEQTQAMYLFASTGVSSAALYKFVPATKALSMVGAVTCPTSGSPFAMSVDRNGVAWALFDNGQLFELDTKTAACTASGLLAGQQGFSTFGMGFVADQQGGTTETLYITQADANPSDDQLGSIDTTQSPPVVSLVGHYNGGMGKPSPLVGAADATGTGDGRLFGFFHTTPTQIAQIDKSTAQILGVASVPGVTIGAAWAFAFWGGTFWLFTWDGFSPTGSVLQQYDPTTQTVTTVSTGIGFVVVGAGVSTCAPLKPPA